MQKVKFLQGKWWNVVFFLTALLVVIADQLSKFWIRSNLAIGESVFKVGFFRVVRVHNSGAAFGLFQGQSFLLTIIALVGVAALLLFVLRFSHHFPSLNNSLGKVSLGLILGGTMGNLIDRLRFGYVTDFIDVSIWPSFNIADSSVVVGVIIFVCSLLFPAVFEKH